MIKIISKLTSLLLLFSFTYTYSQTPLRCATTEHNQNLNKKFPERAKLYQDFENRINQTLKLKSHLKKTATPDTIIYTIPVVVHVIHNNSTGTIGGTNISDAQILSQIEVLNEDYRKKAGTAGYNTHPLGADVRFEFCLATRDQDGNITKGIIRTYNPRTSYDYQLDDNYVKSLIYWPSDQYLNIWVVPKILGPGSKFILGYAQLPFGSSLSGLDPDMGASTDGIVISHKAFGRTGQLITEYNKGKTTTHEVGHWLGGLRHIWGDGYCADDFVADTPLDAGENLDNDCIDSSNCTGIWTQDMTSNYLDYSPDACLNLFTLGQKERMRTAFLESPRRQALINSKGCCGSIGNIYNIPFTQGFEINSSLNDWTINPSISGWQNQNPGSYNESAKSLFVNNTSTNSNTTTYLETPFFNLKKIYKPYLKFDLAYAKNNSSETDTLIISYNYNCNNIWIPLLELSGDKLTTSVDSRNDFIPTATDWKTIYLNLAQFSKINGIKFRFENHSAGANNIYIDNINLDYTSDNLEVNVYPNPVNEFLNYDVLLNDDKDLEVELYSCIGEKLISETIHVHESLHDEIDIRTLAAGMYILKISGNGQSKIIKVLINL